MSDLPTAKSSNPTDQKLASDTANFLAFLLTCYFYYLVIKFVFNLASNLAMDFWPSERQSQLEKELKKEIEKNNKLKDEMGELKYKLGEAKGRARIN
ncbi:hypothetical protein OCU04_008102 [Sclerotinia nivalis]|uniref:Uncharacterized protein n=1 Tax=Sclerotinia nivalis TaxID=352851 RepID=A0A9X0AHE3_9HELO|nr:hypothetical protein OCU04_008102 [Sclerotinia nivalis]